MLVWLSLNLHGSRTQHGFRCCCVEKWTEKTQVFLWEVHGALHTYQVWRKLHSTSVFFSIKMNPCKWTEEASLNCSVSYHVMVGIGEPNEAQWSNAGLSVMTWYTWSGGVSTLGGSAVRRSVTLQNYYPSLLILACISKLHGHDSGIQFKLNGVLLTENIDKSVRHEVTKLVGGVTLVDSTGPWLHIAENHSVIIHLPTGVFRCV